ncbi:CST complex subunit TEN1 isoform X3 [Empidonax traillii]|uniref:CST complex subunit TEN1 isoform X3 n=1 Tax=Empidonax traillii TaxID=164674 RepID=UPI000FFDB5CE|nr:CST complex subunit TEN1 isoform X3 [Empidonax traillii]XP_027763376.1 CST complex subunit TEN1 isoform X3 [Empidonax traillii]
MVPSAGVYYFPWEINSSVPEGEALRTFGRLYCYDLTRSEAVLTAQHSSAQYQVCVNTKLVEPFQAQLGSFYIVLGEAEYREETSSPVVKARILTCVEGMNVPLLEQAIQEQRKYFKERDRRSREKEKTESGVKQLIVGRLEERGKGALTQLPHRNIPGKALTHLD